MRMQLRHSALLMIDLQTRLAPAIHESDRVISHALWLAKLATKLKAPAVITEHCPHKIGHSLPEVLEAAPHARIVHKQHFSAHTDGCLAGSAIEACRQVIVCGTEAHVCVMQTALDLRWEGKDVFVVAQACGSRDPENKALAFERMRGHGIEVVSPEMVAFEWLGKGDTPLFSQINREFIR
jgi:nicotinamidase-related amidase